MPQLSRDEYQAGRWHNKPRALWETTHDRPRNEENCPPNLDYKVIEQIADGVEKMILAWSHGEEREAYPPQSPVTDSGVSSPRNLSRGSPKPIKIKSPLSEKSFQGDVGCNYMCPVQLQDVPAGITAEISINGNCPGAGMGSAISQIVSQAVKHTGTVSNKDMHAEKTVTETATYWYLEARNATNQGSRGSSREVEEKPESSGRIGGRVEVRGWSKEEKDARSISRSDSGGRPEGFAASSDQSIPQRKGSAASSDQSTPQRSGSHHRHGSRHSKNKDVELLRPHNTSAAEQPLISKKTTPNSTPESDMPTDPRHAQAKVKEEAAEVSSLPRVNLVPGREGCLNTQFGSVIIDDELLEKKLAALTTMPPTPLTEGDDLMDEGKLRQCQDLQIALLECAMEYEIKTIELKIKLKSLQSTPKHSDDSKSAAEKDQSHYSKNSRESQIVESMKKQLFKLQREKGAVTKEKFEVQKRNLEDALLRVNRLQRELVRKNQELLDCQLMEKHIQTKLEEAEVLAKATNHSPGTPPGVEPAKLVALLPSLREWVKTLKKDQAPEPAMIKLMEGYCMPGEHNRAVNSHMHDLSFDEPFRQRSANEKLLHADDSHKQFETVVQSLVREVQALQRELGKLGSRNWKHKNQSLPAWRIGMENRQGGRLASGGSPPSKVKRFYNR